MDYVLILDSCTDLPRNYVDENNIPLINFKTFISEEEIVDDLGKTMDYKAFYDRVRAGEMPTTTQINVFTYQSIFNKYIKEGKGVIYLCFSSALSGSYNNACMAREQILEECPEADISVIDSKSASMGEGLLGYLAYEKYKEGMQKADLVKWIEENKLKLVHWFTVDDLNHLKRGGRVSTMAAAVGTILSIKPVMHVDDEGRLIPVYKVKGRKQALKKLADMFKEKAENPDGQVIGISHGDCVEDAKYVEKLITDEFNIKKVIMNNIGPVIGAHSGPGTVALFFLGENREV